jgi:hypothetical protein
MAIGEIGLQQPIASTSTTQMHPIGHKVRCRDMGSTVYGEAEFVYLTGVASVAVGSYCVRDGDLVKLAVARDKGPGCVAMSACVASNYGWFQTTGNAVVLGTAGDTDNKPMSLTSASTPGLLSVTYVAGDVVLGARTAAAITDDGLILVVLANPRTGDMDNSA